MSYEMFITAKQCYRDFGAAKPNKTIFWYFQIIGGIATKLFLYTYLIYSKISIYRCVKSSYMVVCHVYKIVNAIVAAASRREKNRENVSLASSRCPTSQDCWLLEVFLQNAFGFFWLLKDGREAEHSGGWNFDLELVQLFSSLFIVLAASWPSLTSQYYYDQAVPSVPLEDFSRSHLRDTTAHDCSTGKELVSNL